MDEQQIIFPEPNEQSRWYDGIGIYFLIGLIATLIAIWS